ncbi:MAG: Oligopeptide ABC transporter, periplasmic oligopeptide-binding protein OppA [uncultured Blastococcus sp.]|uniref:Oligopeptide ABC transporter, periplasmic oligopeptide-binding protein OppA n=1 Tax=uncultured Blastococcus sp. TaxID=217144 RepID=A0A6J4JF83_9ACTN|nr:MAG: Oligopeptide ABC transporter, periplasmic oligopeptide-binding protein OppA [uncultured Blastococcus sp.]
MPLVGFDEPTPSALFWPTKIRRLTPGSLSATVSGRRGPTMRLIRTAVGACVATTVLAACGGGGDSAGDGEVVEGGTFTLAMDSDPGNLDPQASASSNLFQLSHFAYDSLINMDAEGEIVSGLASDWKVDGETVTLTMADGITCADGSPFTAADAADNLNYVGDPANQSEFLGVFYPAGATAAADADTVTLTLAAPAPFVLEGLAGLPMVCRSALDDRSVLAAGTAGTGPYELTEVVPSDHFTFTKREGYTWGPDGAGTDEKGMPDEVVVRIVSNPTTAANLLLSGELNAARIVGPDAERLDQQGLFAARVDVLLGEMWLNHAEGRPTADPAVRKALTQAVDLAELAKVITSDKGGPATSLASAPPAACPGDSVSGALPEYDVDAAKEALDEAGWTAGADGVRSKNGTPLVIVFLYETGALGAPGAAAAELASKAWTELGADVRTTPQDETAAVETVYGSGDWDVAWLQLNVSSPDQLVPFLSGTVVPEGNNFAHIDNPDYNAAVAEASAKVGAEGCDTWLEAEAHLFRNADIVPFANQELAVYGKGAEFELADVLQPTSIRMLSD